MARCGGRLSRKVNRELRQYPCAARRERLHVCSFSPSKIRTCRELPNLDGTNTVGQASFGDMHANGADDSSKCRACAKLTFIRYGEIWSGGKLARGLCERTRHAFRLARTPLCPCPTGCSRGARRGFRVVSARARVTAKWCPGAARHPPI